MSAKNNLLGGGVAVAAIIGVKILAKTAIFAALFGGSIMANNAYQSRVDEVKREVADFNKKDANAQMEVLEDSKVIVEHYRTSEFNGEDYQRVLNNPDLKNQFDSNFLPAVEVDKKNSISLFKQHKDEYSNVFLISQGWKFVYNYETSDGVKFGSYTISKGDL